MWPKYWEQFTSKNKQGVSKGNGQMFEELVKSLLHAQYGLRWIQTPKSHDDNRDFWILLKDKRIWAECKNYQDKIAMDILAPTLVMATSSKSSGSAMGRSRGIWFKDTSGT